MQEAFPGLSFATHSEEDLLEDLEEIYFFLDSDNEVLFEIYQIAKNYLSEYYGLPEVILIELIKEEKLNLKESLQKIPLIHSGFLSVINPAQKEETNGQATDPGN